MDPINLWEKDEILCKRLEMLLVTTRVMPDGCLFHAKQLVERLGQISIHIYSKEHAPPHFHIKTKDIDALFAIKDCKLIEGSLAPNHRKIIEHWYNENGKERLIKIWNDVRPSDCPVGKIIDGM